MKAFRALLAVISIPFMLLNAFGGIVAGIWLAFLGQWPAIFLGLGIFLIGSFAVSLLLAPGTLLMGAAAVALDRRNKLAGWPLLLMASAWTYAVIIAWEVVIFNVFGGHVTSRNIIPMWLWSYGAATGVWSYLASRAARSGDGDASLVAAFCAQVAYVVLAVGRIWLGLPLPETIMAMALALLCPLVLGLIAFGTASRRYA